MVPGDWTVQVGHDWPERLEADIRRTVPNAHVTTHLEPMEDPVSLHYEGLDRPVDGPGQGRAVGQAARHR